MKRLNNKRLIKKIQKINDVRLLPHEIKFLDALIEAKKYNKKILVYWGRGSQRSLDRVCLMLSVYPKALFPKKTKLIPLKRKRNILKKI
ncbi:MAG: hypothetical protein OSJ70_04910 [Bacilli bacterium]|nr:hypothetical protein [Bacilli bacterium]